MFATIPGDVESRGADACTVRLTAESAELVVQFVAAVAALGAPVTVEEASVQVMAGVRQLATVLGALGAAVE